MALSEKHEGFKQLRGDASNPTFGIAVGKDSRALHIFEARDAGVDWNVSAATHPTLYIHSATTPATDYIQVYHDATDGFINVASGTLKLQLDGTTALNVTATALTSTTHSWSTALTQTSATPGTVRAIYGKNTSFTSMTSGNLVGVRGEVTVGGSVSTGVYLYGVQGKLITGSNTITAGSGFITGVLGQMDMTGGTLTSGWNSAIHADLQGCTTGTHSAFNLITGTHAGGGVINSLIYLFGKSTYAMGFESNVHNNMSTSGTPGSVTGATGWIKVLVDNAVRYIPLASTVS